MLDLDFVYTLHGGIPAPLRVIPRYRSTLVKFSLRHHVPVGYSESYYLDEYGYSYGFRDSLPLDDEGDDLEIIEI
ncbi:MAG: hypothetical protein DRP15_02745 [Candidatus Aenigmatarchaeota archaeon]|nr:MAG: hypothetical protein DRP15_02745 [Candidatus Aenigmarchaeota archaeon]